MPAYTGTRDKKLRNARDGRLSLAVLKQLDQSSHFLVLTWKTKTNSSNKIFSHFLEAFSTIFKKRDYSMEHD